MAGQQRICRTVYFSGRVQGVGFRYNAVRIASRFDVAGFVRNLPDGRVEVVAEGDPKEVRAFLNAVYKAMERYIHDVKEQDCPATGRYVEFGIEY